MAEIFVVTKGDDIPREAECLLVRRDDDGFYRLFGLLNDEPDEFEVTGDTSTSEARAVDSAEAFASSMQVGRIVVVRDPPVTAP